MGYYINNNVNISYATNLKKGAGDSVTNINYSDWSQTEADSGRPAASEQVLSHSRQSTINRLPPGA